VIDRSTQTIYAVAKFIKPDGGIAQKLAAIDLVTGNIRNSATIGDVGAAVPGTATDGTGTVVTFNPVTHLQRPALLLQRGKIYIAFGAHQDSYPYHGWIFAYDAKTLKMVNIWCSTPNGMKEIERAIGCEV
jgi:hypothetical protein